jgi:putative SOS response-associated peptidase YedK
MPLPGSGAKEKGISHPPSPTEPGPDVAPVHNRQVVVLRPENWAAWIHLTKAEGDLLQPLPEGSLDVKVVRAGSD